MSDPAARTGVCPNCGAQADGRFCPSCGQETRVALPKVREFLREAAGRYVALDGRLWRTLLALVARPGFLTREYFAGRRRRYIRPSRLFLVLSVALFAVIRLLSDAPVLRIDDHTAAANGAASRPIVDARDDMAIELDDIESWSPALAQRLQRFRKLPAADKVEQINAGVLRYGPYAMLALLPASALLLQAVYAGRRRSYPQRPRRYAQHLVFAAHIHAFLCVIAMLAFVLRVPGSGPLLVAWAGVYCAWAMHAVYGGRWSGVIVRGLVVALAYVVLFALAVAALVVAAALLR